MNEACKAVSVTATDTTAAGVMAADATAAADTTAECSRIMSDDSFMAEDSDFVKLAQLLLRAT